MPTTDNQYKTINKTWIKNRLKKGLFEFIVNGKYTDDYAFDNSINYGKTTEWVVATEKEFDDWFIGSCMIYGDKTGEFNVSFASSENYTFRLKK